MAVFHTEALLLFAFIAYLLSGAQSALYLGDNWQKTEETRLLPLAFFGGNFSGGTLWHLLYKPLY